MLLDSVGLINPSSILYNRMKAKKIPEKFQISKKKILEAKIPQWAKKQKEEKEKSYYKTLI